MLKKVYIQTWGCQMNVYDTELVKAILANKKYAFVQDELQADIVMLNTCAIRENAHRKVYGRIHDVKYKRNGKPVKIGILGCMATNLRTDLLENKNLDIDFIAGPDSYKRLPDLIEESYRTGDKQFDLTLSEFETYSDVYPQRGTSSYGDKREAKGGSSHSGIAPEARGLNAWIAVMRGCNNFCTFCVVPYTRGRERSRSVANVVDEAKRLADEGFKQVTLLGQNVNSYKHEDKDFADLMEAVSRVNGIERIRFTSPHPKDFPDKFLDLMAENPKVCKQIHLPLQSGNTRILDLMNRTYTKEEFLNLVDHVRAKVPGVALSTDVIVGFSSETDEDFEDTYDVMKKVEFDTAFTFKYSERKQTIASRKYPDDVPDAIKTERIVRLTELQKDITLKKNRAYIGKTLDVLIENPSTKHADCLVGRADGNQLVVFQSEPRAIGDIVPVKIEDASPAALKGTLKD